MNGDGSACANEQSNRNASDGSVAGRDEGRVAACDYLQGFADRVVATARTCRATFGCLGNLPPMLAIFVR